MSYPSYEEIQKVRKQLFDIQNDHWLHDDLLKWSWWLLLALTVIPYMIWWRLVDRQRMHEIMLYGMIIGIFSSLLDCIGTDALWWGYPDKLTQTIPPLVPADFVLIPVWMMLVYQLTARSFPLFLAANILYGLISAFVFEPIFIALNYYTLNSWKLSYSFIFYVVASVITWWIVKKTTPSNNLSRMN